MKAVLAGLLCATASFMYAASSDHGPDKIIMHATRAFNEIQGMKEKGIPDKLLSRANGIIIIPALKRAGFVFGGEYGKGVFVARTPNGWSAPSIVKVEGGSFGLQIGGGETDLILLAMNQDAVKELMNTGVKLGGDAGVMAGPIGREAEADTTPMPTGGLLAYSRAKGAFAGLTLKGTTLRSDDKDNAELYGPGTTQAQILSGSVKPPAGAAELDRALARYFRANPSAEKPPRKGR